MHAAPAPAERTGTPTLKLGQIADRLGFTLTADFLKGLGFEPAATDRASKLYHEADFALILTALVHHIEAVQSKAAFALPSRVGGRLHYPDGRVEVVG